MCMEHVLMPTSYLCDNVDFASNNNKAWAGTRGRETDICFYLKTKNVAGYMYSYVENGSRLKENSRNCKVV